MKPLYNRYRISLIFLVLFLTVLSGCKKLADVPAPATSITEANVYSSDATAIAVMTALYARAAYQSHLTGYQSTTNYLGVSADEISLWSGFFNDNSLIAHYKNALILNPSNEYYGSELWNPFYQNIFVCNSVLDGVGSSTGLTDGVKQQLIGEAKFMRAFSYFYLVNIYGDVPLALTADYSVNSKLSRSPKAKVYEQIIADLTDAQAKLSPLFLNVLFNGSYVDRVRPSSWAASALLARVYLYTGQYDKAEAQATTVISNSSLFSLSPLSNTFLRSSLGNNEAIWQLQSVGLGTGYFNTGEGYYYVIPTTGPNQTNAFVASNTLISSFEPGDARKTNWIGTYGTGVNTLYYSNKYKLGSQSSGAGYSESLTVLRLAEVYLIRAEARAQQGTNLSGAAADLNAVRTRASLANTTATTQQALLNAIMHERQVELFFEFGHRWLDLKRTGTVDAVMTIQTPIKSGNTVQWTTTQQLYPVPNADILLNKNLTQNPGY